MKDATKHEVAPKIKVLYMAVNDLINFGIEPLKQKKFMQVGP